MTRVWNRSVLVALVLLGIGFGPVASPAYADIAPQAAAAAKPSPTDSLYMISQRSGRCAEVPGFSTSLSTRVDQYTCVYDYHLNEMWYFKYTGSTGGHSLYNIINTNSGLCMNVSGNSTANSAAVIQYTCSTTAANNLWYVDEVSGYHVWRNHHSGKCLNVAGASTSNGAYLIQYTCGNYDNEHWTYQSLCPSSSGVCVRWPWYGW